MQRVFHLMMLVPSNRRRVEREMSTAMNDIAKSLMPPSAVPTIWELPAHGRDSTWVQAQLEALQRLGAHGEADGRDVYLDGQVSGTVYLSLIHI